MRMTKNREAVLEIIESSRVPLTAEEIHRKLDVNLSTVYRALKFLEERNLVGSFSVGGPRYFFKKKRHYHFLICEKCGKLFPFEECVDEFLKKLQEKYDFSEESHLFLIHGICKECKKEVEK